MPGRANDLIVFPDSFWERPNVIATLRSRNIGLFFILVQEHTGASQTQIGIAIGWSQGKVSDLERGAGEVKHLAVFEQIADGLNFPDPARIALGLAPRARSQELPGREARGDIQRGDTRPVLPPPHPSSLLNLGLGDEQEGNDAVRRRTFVGLTGAATLNSMFADATPDAPALKAEPFAPVLAAQAATIGEAISQPPDIRELAAAVDNARQRYQDCRYFSLTKTLPALLARLHAACLALDGDEQSRAFALSADAHHVAAGLLLKLDDQGLAYLAADRSMRAAETSGDPVTVGASARIITHTLMAGGHLSAAITTASSHAQQLDHNMPTQTPDSLSVYGSLLLRGAIAAAQHDQRDTAHGLLGEADEAARRLGVDGNLRWTAFGPTNAKLHRVSIAVMLGDAGTAVDVARKVDLSAITVTERKASLLVDTARAFLQWGKHEKAYIALRAAEETAHEEVAGRPSVHRIVRELMSGAPPSMRRDVEQFAAQIGVSR
jgi:hypothetical protein